MSNEVIDRVTGLLTAFDARVQAASADSWANQSPCPEWTARDVVVHVGNNILGLTAGLTSGEARQIAADDDIVAVWNEALAGFLGAINSADLGTKVPGPMGPMAAADVIGRFVSMDVLVHTWDLARAVGGDETLDAEACARSYSGLKPMDAMIRQPGLFGPKTEAPAGADAQTEFLCFLGRPV